jgi:hypothetical protein
MIKMNEDKQMRTALFPILSIAYPKKGDVTAEIMYGIPKSRPA